MDETQLKDAKELVDELKLKSAAVESTEKEESDSSTVRVYTDPNDGTQYEWNEEKRAWFPKVN